MDKNAAAPVATVQSTEIYLVLPDLVIEGDGTLTAQVIFDLPTAAGGSLTDVWAVALNFKYGDQNDDGPLIDFDAGPTCQFSNGGNVKLNKTSSGAAAAPTNYAQFATYPPAEFVLTMDMVVAHGVLQSSTGTLTYGGPPLSGDVKIPANFNLGSVTAVGVAVVSTTNDFTKFGARLRSFILSATPLVFGVH